MIAGKKYVSEYATLEYKEREYDGKSRLCPFLTLTDLGVFQVLEAWKFYRADEIEGRNMTIQSPDVLAVIQGTEAFLRELALHGKEGVDLYSMKDQVAGAEVQVDFRIFISAKLNPLFEQAFSD